MQTNGEGNTLTKLIVTNTKLASGVFDNLLLAEIIRRINQMSATMTQAETDIAALQAAQASLSASLASIAQQLANINTSALPPADQAALDAASQQITALATQAASMVTTPAPTDTPAPTPTPTSGP